MGSRGVGEEEEGRWEGGGQARVACGAFGCCASESDGGEVVRGEGVWGGCRAFCVSCGRVRLLGGGKAGMCTLNRGKRLFEWGFVCACASGTHTHIRHGMASFPSSTAMPFQPP